MLLVQWCHQLKRPSSNPITLCLVKTNGKGYPRCTARTFCTPRIVFKVQTVHYPASARTRQHYTIANVVFLFPSPLAQRCGIGTHAFFAFLLVCQRGRRHMILAVPIYEFWTLFGLKILRSGFQRSLES